MADDDELEYTLLNKRDVLVYQIPPASSASGHKADDWKTCIWRGRCRVAGKGSDLNIKMLDSSTGALFAQCAIPGGEYDKYVERVIDSSRYFVLKITNGARHAFIGLGFEDRNDAFDFNCTLSDFKSTWVDRDKQVEELAPIEQGPAKDLSLKEGQKITVNLNCLGGSRRREQKKEGASDGGGFGGLLAPPPSGGAQSRRQQQAVPLAPPAAQPVPAVSAIQAPAASPSPPASAPATGGFQDDFFGDFDDFQSAGATAVATPTPVANPPAAMAASAPTGGAAGTGSGLSDQLGMLNLGGFSSPSSGAPTQTAQPMMPTQPQAAAPPAQPNFDPFSGMDILGGPSSPATPQQTSTLPPQTMQQPQMSTFSPPSTQQPMSAMSAFSPPSTQRPKKGGSDPFDEFDIFK